MMNLDECRSYLNEGLSLKISDHELLQVRDQLQAISEVLVEHALNTQM